MTTKMLYMVTTDYVTKTLVICTDDLAAALVNFEAEAVKGNFPTLVSFKTRG